MNIFRKGGEGAQPHFIAFWGFPYITTDVYVCMCVCVYIFFIFLECLPLYLNSQRRFAFT